MKTPSLPKNRQDTLSEPPILPDEIELFEKIECSFETKLISKKNLLIQPMHWRSSEFSKLDQIHITKMLTLQGPQHVQAFNIEHIRKPLMSPLPTPSSIIFHTTCPSTVIPLSTLAHFPTSKSKFFLPGH
ncbi:hypothetical protein VP01_60g6 [Puccinia sorghi]|uniref:Uncharacterized protein n=1 Tax=Puccinia sorghi TaxID=27349 RepID=A0A0L6UH26_9BASI|nr:hypothetical protein VP01_60g6 [Puccinia sorghi]